MFSGSSNCCGDFFSLHDRLKPTQAACELANHNASYASHRRPTFQRVLVVTQTAQSTKEGHKLAAIYAEFKSATRTHATDVLIETVARAVWVTDSHSKISLIN